MQKKIFIRYYYVHGMIEGSWRHFAKPDFRTVSGFAIITDDGTASSKEEFALLNKNQIKKARKAMEKEGCNQITTVKVTKYIRNN